MRLPRILLNNLLDYVLKYKKCSLVICSVSALVYTLGTGWWLYSNQQDLLFFFAYWIGLIILSLFLLEVSLRFLISFRTGFAYFHIPKLGFDKLYIEPHPYLPTVYKKNFQSQKRQPVIFPLSKEGEFYFPQLTSNNIRHNDGLNGDRLVEIPKPKNRYRIVCLGASTTGTYLESNGVNYSYPLLLEEKLRKCFPHLDLEVNNCGQGGWTSADVLSNFMFKVYDLQPDLVIIYHAYNDIPSYLTPDFSSDYSHSKQSFAHAYEKFKWNRYIPDIPLASYNYFVKNLVKYWNPRYGVVEATSKSEPDYSRYFVGLDTYQRNIEHIVKICRESGIEVLLSSFVHYLYPEIEASLIHQKHAEGVNLENQRTHAIALKYGLDYIDMAKQFPRDKAYFVDSIHFSPRGMDLLSDYFCNAVAAKIMSDTSDKNLKEARDSSKLLRNHWSKDFISEKTS